MESRWTEIEEVIRKFQAFLIPEVTPLKIQKGIDFSSDIKDIKFRKQCGELTNRGVYLFFDESESLRYVGCTHLQALGGRIPQSISRLRKRRWTDIWEKLRWIDVIPFKDEWLFLAPALENYLIDQEVFRGWNLLNKLGASDRVLRGVVRGIRRNTS